MDELDRIRHNKMKDMIEKIRIIDLEDENMQNNGKPFKLTDTNFNDFITGHKVVLVDCWAAWCGPCRMLEPTIDELAKQYSGNVAITKLNVDDNPGKAQEYGIMGIPTMLLFKDGRLADKIVGVTPKSAIETKLKKLM
ncbi:MAG: thioredoxin [Thermoplasmata archaeon]|nr:MAG: thioredoxin [Thermoplasmata archaeon]